MPQLMRAQTPSLNQLPNTEPVRIYPYILTGVRENIALLGPNTISFVAVSQAAFNDKQFKLLLDANDNYYFTAIAAKTKDQTISASSDADSFIETLYSALSGYLLSNNCPYQINQSMVVTIGNPMLFDSNHQQIRTDKDKVFMVTKINPTIEVDNWYEVTGNILEEESYAEIMINETEVLKNRYTNCEIKFYENDAGTISPKDGASYSGLTFKTDKGTLLANNFISISGQQFGEDTRVESNVVELDEGNVLYPIKADNRFISNNELGMYFDWFDKSLYLPFEGISSFTTPNDLKSLLQYTTNGTYQNGAYNLIYDMLTVTNLYLRNFSMPNITGWRLKPDSANPVALGQIDPKWYIGTEFLRNVLEISNQNPQVVVDGMYNEFRSKYTSIPIDYLKLVKSVIGSLSRVIVSNFSFGGGNNDALRSIVPWYLLPSSITLQENAKTSNLNAVKTTFSFQSDYFQISNEGKLLRKNIITPNTTIEIQGEQTQFIPKVPDSLPQESTKEQNSKEQLPSAMLYTDENALEWIWYIGLDNNESFEKVINGTGSSGSSTVKLTNQSTIDAPTDNNLATETAKRDYITAYYKNRYGSNAVVQIVSTGVVNTTLVAGGNIAQEWGAEPANDWRYWDSWGKSNLTDTNSANRNLTSAQQLSFTSIVSTLPVSELKVNRVEEAYYNYDGNSDEGLLYVNFRWSYNRVQYYLTGVSVNITFKTTILNPNKLVFNRTEWRNYIKSQGVTVGQQTYYIREINNDPIDVLDEVMLTMIWDRNSIINTGEFEFTINSFNAYDETVSLTRVSFT